MAIKYPNGILYSGPENNFDRDVFVGNVSDLNLDNYPKTFLALSDETGEAYILNKDFKADSLGKWKSLTNQYKEMPAASEKYKNDTIQYAGETNENFTAGCFYKIKEEAGEPVEKQMCAFDCSNGTVYFSEEISFEFGDEVSLYIKNGENFEKSSDIGYYYGDDGFYLNNEDELTRAEDKDETASIPTFTYSWEALSSGGAEFETATEAEINALFD